MVSCRALSIEADTMSWDPVASRGVLRDPDPQLAWVLDVSSLIHRANTDL